MPAAIPGTPSWSSPSVTVVSGGQTCIDLELYGQAKPDLLQSFPKLKNGIPSHDTFSRTLKTLDPEACQQWFLGFMGQFAEGLAGVAASDGQTLRRSCDRAAGQSPPHLVTAWADAQRLALGPAAVDAMSNEITAAPPLLAMLSLPGQVVAADARRCQRQAAQQVVSPGGDCALALKGNQGTSTMT